MEELTIKIKSNKNNPLFIRNIYIPPASSCNQGYIAPADKLAEGLNDNSLILGDPNAHHNLWNTEDTEDERGRAFAKWIGDTDLGVLNEDVPTRVTATSSTSPDISIATPSLLPTCTWVVNTTLGSDHLPILIKLTTEIKKIPAAKNLYKF